MTPRRIDNDSDSDVDVVVAGDGDAAKRAAAAAVESGATVLVLDGRAVTALLRPADAVHGVCHRTAEGGAATVGARAVVLAADGDHAAALRAAAAGAGAPPAADGPRVDAGARVLDRHGLSIPGLYAAIGAAAAADAGARAAARAAATRSPEPGDR